MNVLKYSLQNVRKKGHGLITRNCLQKEGWTPNNCWYYSSSQKICTVD